MAIDVAIRKTLRTRQRRFELDVRFASTARRIAVIGPSGGGKSLTLKAIAGLERPDAGHIRIDGLACFDARQRIDLPPRQRRTGFLFQDYALFPHLDVRQNIAFGLGSGGGGGWDWGWSGSLLNPRRGSGGGAVDYWLEVFELDAVARQFPHQLSGGQRQRVALARALAVEPRVLLLDEPFAAVDALLRQRMRQELDRLQRRLDIPMILITHDPLDAEALADEIFHLCDGAITGSGTDWQVLEEGAQAET